MAQNQKTVTGPIRMDSRKFLGAEEETKRCPDCGNDLPTSHFGSNRTRLYGLQTICGTCKSERNKKSERTRTRLTWPVRKHLKKEEVCDWLRLNGVELRCSECPQDHPATLDFHHNDPLQKSFSISFATRRGYSLQRILEEVKKCTILCSNCHRVHHWTERQTTTGVNN